MATGSTIESRDDYSRVLTPEEVDKLQRDTQLVSDFKRNKLEAEAKRNWDLFYKRNQTNFFKDRHWITREFPELLQQDTEVNTTHTYHGKLTIVCFQSRHLLEAGCGVGNTVFPLLEETTLFIYACDFSPRAVEFVKVSAHKYKHKCNALATGYCKSSDRNSSLQEVIPCLKDESVGT